MNLSLKEWNLVIDVLREKSQNLPGSNTDRYNDLANKIQDTKFTNNMSSFSPD